MNSSRWMAEENAPTLEEMKEIEDSNNHVDQGESQAQWLNRMWDLTSGDNAKPSIATKYGYNKWSVVTICSMRNAVLWMADFGKGSFILRKAPRGEYTITTKELNAMLEKERS